MGATVRPWLLQSIRHLPATSHREPVAGEGRPAAVAAEALKPGAIVLAIVTHAGIIRLILAHYLGAPSDHFHRIRVSPGSVLVLAFGDDRELPRLFGINLSSGLARVVHG
jgi:broad specificity phosphatase PhoE